MMSLEPSSSSPFAANAFTLPVRCAVAARSLARAGRDFAGAAPTGEPPSVSATTDRPLMIRILRCLLGSTTGSLREAAPVDLGAGAITQDHRSRLLILQSIGVSGTNHAGSPIGSTGDVR